MIPGVSSFITGYLSIPSVLFNSSPNLYTSISSFKPDICVNVFAFPACVRIPLSPTNVAIVTPAKISKIIIVITNAINVIPLYFVFYFLCFSHFVLSPFFCLFYIFNH